MSQDFDTYTSFRNAGDRVNVLFGGCNLPRRVMTVPISV
jgi:hypothetical protein